MRNGEVQLGKGEHANVGDLALFERAGDWVEIHAQTDAGLLLLAGEPINEPIIGHGPFVMNSRTEIQQAFEDYHLGRMGELKD